MVFSVGCFDRVGVVEHAQEMTRLVRNDMKCVMSSQGHGDA